MRPRLTQLGVVSCIGLAVVLQLSCSSEPTSNAEPSFNHGPSHLTIFGPAEITSYTKANYTYTAYMNGTYVGWSVYPWAVRYCPTLKVELCTTTWQPRQGSVVDENRNKLTTPIVGRDCSGGGTKSFQVRAQASAFGQGTVTAYKVTKLCGTEIP